MANQAPTNRFWWPDLLDLGPLRQQAPASSPMGDDFNYAEEFKTLDLAAVKKDIEAVLTASQDWWPADYGHYGPLMIRMAWHGAGTYRVADGRGGARGGQMRFEPLNSWPDNANLDKARRLIWPVKAKYGRKLSWADLMILTGNVALESMGFETFGFAGGRVDEWEADQTYWGPETEWLADERYSGDRDLAKTARRRPDGPDLREPGGAERQPGPGRGGPGHPRDLQPDVHERRGDRRADRRRPHLRQDPRRRQGGERGAGPGGRAHEQQGLGWKNKAGSGCPFTSGLEGAWSANPVRWTSQFFDNLFGFEWELSKSPAGKHQWVPAGGQGAGLVPDAQDRSKRHTPVMLTTDLSLRFDPEYSKISKRFHENPEEFKVAFAKAWFKLTHRDMGPKVRYLGGEVPDEALIWQDPVPAVDHELIDAADAAALKAEVLASGLGVSELVRTAWASASSFRNTDLRGGANGARVRLAPQKDWEVNAPAELAKVLGVLEGIQSSFNGSQTGGKRVSLADLIVLAGAAAVESAAKAAGHEVEVPFTPGRTDASEEQTDADSFAVLEPAADGFRNHFTSDSLRAPAEALVDKASTLNLTAPEMTALVGGMRALGANSGNGDGVFTDRPGTLSNDFFVNLLDMSTAWSKSADSEGLYEGRDRTTGKLKWTATPVDLIFGSNSELRAIAEVYGADDGGAQLARDFAAAWDKVMTLDRFDV